jgi:hypothetical protein
VIFCFSVLFSLGRLAPAPRPSPQRLWEVEGGGGGMFLFGLQRPHELRPTPRTVREWA